MNDDITNLLAATCGNVMASDDAFGPLVARELRRVNPPGVEVIDLDIRPAALLDHLAGRSGLILLDAVHAPDHEPGMVLDIDWFSEARPALLNDDTMSTHGLSIAMQLELAGRLGLLPPIVRLIAMTLGEQPKVGHAVSESLASCVIRAADRVVMHAARGIGADVEHHHA